MTLSINKMPKNETLQMTLSTISGKLIAVLEPPLKPKMTNLYVILHMRKCYLERLQ